MAARVEKERDIENVEQPQKKKRSGFKMILMAAAGALFVGGLLMGVVIYFFGIPGVVPKMKTTPPPQYELLELGERVVNLADHGGMRYLRLRIVLEFKKNEKLAAEIKEKNAPVMEDILHVLRSKSVDDIRPLDKEEKVKQEIMSKINTRLKNGKVERVYFSDFLIQ
ncbi:MAG: flagellar basal body-associated FliL family protein [Bacillota bacterium]